MVGENSVVSNFDEVQRQYRKVYEKSLKTCVISKNIIKYKYCTYKIKFVAIMENGGGKIFNIL